MMDRWIKAVLALTLIALFLGGIWLYREQREAMRLEVQNELTAIAHLKADQIAAWRADQLIDAAVLQKHPFMPAMVARFFAEPKEEHRQNLLLQFGTLAEQHDFADILLLDPEGRERLSLTGGNLGHHDLYAPALAEALTRKRPVFVDLHQESTGQISHFYVVTPLFSAASEPLGGLVLISDATRFLYPLIQTWPTASQSAETLLVRRDGDHVLYLNALRYQPDAALRLRIPLSRVDVPAVMAAEGRQGYVQGRDYRGVEVAAVIVPMEGTSWSMIAKIDVEEAFASWRLRSTLLLVLLAGLSVQVVIIGVVLRQREQKVHYQALYEAEAAKRAILERHGVTLKAVGDGVVATDSQGRVELLNPTAERLTGWTEEAAHGRPLEEIFVLVHAHEGHPIANPVQEVLATGNIVGLANHAMLIAKNGDQHHVADSAAPIRDEGGRLVGVVLVFRDVTESYRLRQAMEHERRMLQLFIEHAPAAIAMFDRQMRYLAVSRRFLIDYDLGDRNVIGRSHYEVFPDIPQRWRDVHRRCLDGAVERCEEDTFPRADGRMDWICWEIHPWYEGPGKPGGIILFSEVITKRKLAEQALQQSEDKFRNLFHKHAAVKLIIDPENGNIVEANEAAEKFYGWPRTTLQQMRIQDINTLSPEQIRDEIDRVRKQQRIYFEFRHRRADGLIRDVAVYSSDIDIHGKSLLHSIIHDITEFRQLEARLRQAQKMEAIGRLAGGVAHDFNNMLNVILGYAHLALEKTDSEDPRRDDLLEIQKAAERSAEITRQLLAFARRQTVSPQVLDLNRAVGDTLKMLGRLIGEQIELVWRPGEAIWPVGMDPAQLDQILANLCVNARDAIADTGTITIETRKVTLDQAACLGHAEWVPGDFVLLTVSDTGRGMDKTTLENIFEPFYTTKEIGEGTGLGLATVHGIVTQNNGFVGVDSEPGTGTVFRIYLPRCPEKADKAVIEKAESRSVDRGETILIAEDEPALLKMVTLMLEGRGYRVLAAGSPAEAIRLAETHAGAINLLITDVVMPKMNGRDLADRLRALHPHLKILFMSGHTARAIDSQGMLEPGVVFMPKPFTMAALSAKIHEALCHTANLRHATSE